jgi:hypothetical protein
MTPGQASKAGKILVVHHPVGGRRIAPHVFDLEEDGIAFIDDGWTAPLVSYHVAHIIQGKVLSRGCRDKEAWSIRSEGGEVVVDIYPGDHRQEGSREDAKTTIQQSLMVTLPPN